MLALSAEGTWVFMAANTSPLDDSPEALTLSAPPELTVDSTGTKLVSTGTLDVNNAKEWGLETGGYWQNLFFQAGWFGYNVDQHVEPPALPKPSLSFDGWYAEASWILTGESKGWNQATGAFTAPKPAQPFTFDGTGWGAWEVAARYSDLDLNDNTGVVGLAAPYGGVRGGEQRIFTLGLNWYPNSVVKFALDYQHIDLDRLNSAAPYQDIGQTVQAISLRSQISL
jgi:phosphate-selective porin OprO/OprP